MTSARHNVAANDAEGYGWLRRTSVESSSDNPDDRNMGPQPHVGELHVPRVTFLHEAAPATAAGKTYEGHYVDPQRRGAFDTSS
jgi:hypothetical protein